MIAYVDTSVLLKLLVDDEPGRPAAEQLWLTVDVAACAEIGYVEARSALAAMFRARRLDRRSLREAKRELDLLWRQTTVVPVTSVLIGGAADLAEQHGLRGYDAVHFAAALAIGADILATSDRKLIDAAASRAMAVPGSAFDAP